MDRIIRDGNRAGEVITRIRSFLKRGEIQREPIDVEAVIDDVFELVRAEALTLRVTIRHLRSGCLPPVIADRVQVQQVVLNLAMNALEAICRAAGGARAIEMSAHVHAADAVRVDVRDTGAGIEPAIRDAVFNPFLTTKPEGMGMGLAISRSIVEAHGGRLWMTPNDGAGVTFSFTLPVEPATPPQP